MLDLRDHVAGEIITPEWGNYVDQTLLLHDVRLAELALELALQGLAPDFISLYYDLFNDTSLSDAGVLTADLDVGDKTLHLPTSWTADTDYVYQTIEKVMEYSAAAAHLLVRHNGSAHATITPKLSVIASGSHTFVAGTLIDSRDTVATLGLRTDTFDSLAYVDTVLTTAYVDTAASAVRLPGGIVDSWEASVNISTNAVADIQSDGGADYNLYRGAACTFLADGTLAVAYESNGAILLSVVNEDGTLKTWSGSDTITVIAAGYNPCIVAFSDGNVGVAYSASFQPKYVKVNMTSGMVGTPFNGSGAMSNSYMFKMLKEVDSDYVWFCTNEGNPGYVTLYRFAHDATAHGTAVVASATGATQYIFDAAIDQENDIHVIYTLSAGTDAKYNIWDKSGGAWLYTFGTAKDLDSDTKDIHLLTDVTQAGSNKKAWFFYVKNNGSAKKAVYYQTIINGTVSSPFTVKTSASKDYQLPHAIQNTNEGYVHITYTNSTDGLQTNTIVAATDVLGTEATIDAGAVAALSTMARNGDIKLGIVYRYGVKDNAASEAYVSTKNTGYTLLPKLYQSTVFTIQQQAQKFLLSTAADLPANTTATWEISADNGAHYQSATPGTVGTFTYPGTQLLVRATLQTTDNSVTPTIDTASMKALLYAVEETYEWQDLAGTKVKLQLNIQSDNTSDDTVLYDVGLILS